MFGPGLTSPLLGEGFGGSGGSSGFSGRDVIWVDLRFPSGVGNNGTDEFPFPTANLGLAAVLDGGTLAMVGGDASLEPGVTIGAKSFAVRGFGGQQTSGGLPPVLPTLTYSITSGTQRLAFHNVSVALVAASAASLTQLFFHFCPSVTVTAGSDAPAIFYNGDLTCTFSGSGGTARFRGGTIAGYTATGSISVAGCTVSGNLTASGSISFRAGCAFTSGITVSSSSITIDENSYAAAIAAGVTFTTQPGLQEVWGTPVDIGTANSAGTAQATVHADHVHALGFGPVNNALAAANAPININGQKITGAAAPTSGSDLVTKTYADAIAAGLKVKTPAVAVATANQGTLSGTAQTIDGVALNTIGQRVLLTAQTTATQNGLWTVQSGAWTRPTDFATGSSAAQSYVLVTGGTVNAGSSYFCTNTAGSDVVDTSNLTWVLFSQAAVVNAGAGMTKTGNTLDVIANADGTIVVAADDVKVGVIGNTNLADNTIALSRIVNATAQYDFLMRVSSGGGSWERGTLAQAQAALGIVSSGALKAVRAATTASITLSGTQTIDGVACIAGDRVLAKNQTTGSQNGVYVVAAGAWSRASDLSSSSQIFGGLIVPISEGTTNGNRAAILTTDDPITLGTTSLTFAMDRLAPVTSTAPLDVSKSAASIGTSTEAARQDHKHDITTAAPTGGVTAGGLAAEGTATTIARSDHAHPVSVAAPVDIGTANAPGSAATFVRSDHVHNLPFSTVQTVLGGATGSVSVNSQKITSLANGTVSTDAVNLGQLNSAISTAVGTTAAPANPGDNGKVAYASGGALVYAAGVTTTGSDLTVTDTAATGTVVATLKVTDAAHTALTASTERYSALFDFGQTRQFATGALTNQRAAYFIAPTYSFVAASTITTAATVAISGPPTAGTNATITQAVALLIENGGLSFGTGASTGAATFGKIRVPHMTGDDVLDGRNQAGTQNVPLIRWGAFVNDMLYLGSTSSDSGKVATLRFGIHTGGSYVWEINGGSVATLDGTALALSTHNLTLTTGVITFTTSTAGSTAAAGAGLLRVSGTPGVIIGSRNYDNTGDVTAFGVSGDGTTFNDLYVGEGSSKGHNSLYLRSKTQAIVELATVQQYKFFTTYADFTTSQLRFGTTPATSAHVNAPNATTIIAAHKASTGDMALLATNSSNEMLLGDTSNVVNIYQQFAGSLFLKQGSTTFARLDTSVGLSLFNGIATYYPVTCSTVTLGAGAATSAQINTGRSPGGVLSSRNYDNTGDQVVIGVSGDSATFTDVRFGDDGAKGHNTLYLQCKGAMALSVAGTQEMTVNSTTVDIKSNNLRVDNAASVPSAPGSGGYLYAEGGAGKWVSSSGTRTTFGFADPHCPRCGADFAHEWESPKYGKLSYCSLCLVAALERAGIAQDEYVIERKVAA